MSTVYLLEIIFYTRPDGFQGTYEEHENYIYTTRENCTKGLKKDILNRITKLHNPRFNVTLLNYLENEGSEYFNCTGYRPVLKENVTHSDIPENVINDLYRLIRDFRGIHG